MMLSFKRKFYKYAYLSMRLSTRLLLGKERRNRIINNTNLYNKLNEYSRYYNFFEDYNKMYGFLDYTNKKVIDIGADIGSTAEFFLNKGATIVLAIEGNKERYKELYKKFYKNIHVIPYYCWIDSTRKMDDIFFTSFRYDIAKIDIENAERFLLDIPIERILSINEYIIECHTEIIYKKLKQLFKELHYKNIFEMNITKDVNIIGYVKE